MSIPFTRSTRYPSSGSAFPGSSGMNVVKLEKRRMKPGQGGLYLSGGQQQMLVIARALMGRPKLLLMDEPSLGLSPMVVQMIGRIVLDINQKGQVS